MTKQQDNLILPKDLYDCENKLKMSLKSFLEVEDSKHIQVNILFEGLKLQPLVYRLYKELKIAKIESIILFSDFGNAALAKRDYPDLSDLIYTFKDLVTTEIKSVEDKLFIVCSPQPYEFEDFENLCNSFNNRILMINGKLEETSIGVGSVGRERRVRFIKSWNHAFFIQPFTKGALLYEYPSEWALFSYSNEGYTYLDNFKSKPTKDEINIALI